jgi:hypothetical protein
MLILDIDTRDIFLKFKVVETSICINMIKIQKNAYHIVFNMIILHNKDRNCK